MGICPDAVLRLIEHFDRQKDQVRSPDYNETQLRIDFINPLFQQLGWDMDNRQGFAEQYREVVHEDRVKVAGATKAPDYSFRIGGVRKFFLEAKKPAVDIKHNWEPAYQLRRYAWSAKLAVSLLTDFEELAIYDCRLTPKQLDKPGTARRQYVHYQDYPKQWEFIDGTFSKRAVLTGEFDRYCATKKGRGAQAFDDAFLEEIEEWRKTLAQNLALRNETLDEQSLNFAVQRIIDRIIFLRICEDRGVEPAGHLQQLLSGEQTYARLQKLFRDADDRYNSGLFHFKAEKNRGESPDELTPSLAVDDAALKSILKRLYYPESPYEFTVVSADILGSVYERFLGKVITLTSGHRAKIEEKPEVRKAGGVYYTPTYIVDYIVKQTVGKLLEGKTPKEAAKLKILDPACGSGSFLLGAYQYVLDWHLKWYVADGPTKHSTGKNATIRPADKPTASSLAATPQDAGAIRDPDPALGHWALTTRERKRILLDNLHGVDIDYQAVEVTKLSLLLKCLEGETMESLRSQLMLFHERALPDLGRNIQCGNSLVGTDIFVSDAWREMSEEEQGRVNPFDYERAFADVFRRGGFDAVIGNPPYIRMEEFKEIKGYLREKYKCHGERSDLYAYFMERGHRLLNPRGRFGMIVSNKFLRANYGKPLREVLRELATPEYVADFAGLPVFQGATVRTVVYIASRQGAGGEHFQYAPPPSSQRFLNIQRRAVTVDANFAEMAYPVAYDSLDGNGWSFARADVAALMQRLTSGRQALSTYVSGRICMGVKSGLTEAFIIDRQVRDDIVRSNPEAEEIIKPVLNGRDIERYHIEASQKYLIYTFHGVNIRRYPAVQAHLRPFKEKLEGRATRQEWYELQQPQMRFASFMDGPKIIFPDIATEPRFALDASGHYGTNTTYFIPEVDKHLLALLNSRLAFFFFTQRCAGLEGGGETYLRFFGQYLEGFPVAPPADEALAQRADQMLSLHRAAASARTPQEKEQLQRRIEAADRQTDQLVYRLYGLNDDEIRLVESATAPAPPASSIAT